MKDKERKKTKDTPKPDAKMKEFLALREKRHRFDQLMRWGQQNLEEQFGPWAPPPRSPEELEELFFRMFGDLRS
jgi:hypothetical protein